MSELLDQTVERLPWLRRKVAQRRLRNDKYREAFLDEFCLKCCDNPEVAKILGAPTCAGLMSGDITTITKFAIDPDKLERLFQILIEYLPKLLEIILPLFMQTILFVLAFSLLGTAVNAQQCDPKTGQRHPVKNALAATAEVAGKTLNAIGDAITPDCVCGPNCQCNAGGTPCECSASSTKPKATSTATRVSSYYESSSCCQASTSSPPPVSSVQTFYVTSPAYSTTSYSNGYSSSWSKSWHKVDRQPLRNFGRRILGR